VLLCLLHGTHSRGTTAPSQSKPDEEPTVVWCLRQLGPFLSSLLKCRAVCAKQLLAVH